MSIKLDVNVFVFGVSFLALLSTHFVTGTMQKITFYDQPNCTGKSEELTVTNGNLTNTFKANATSTRVVGIWKIDFENGGNQNYRTTLTDNNPPQGKCINKINWPAPITQDYTISGATRVGPSNIATSQLILYSGSNLNETDFLITSELDLLSPIEFRSYALFSNDSWTVFSQAGFSGTTTVLSPTFANNSDNFVVKIDVSMLIGSVRKVQTGESGGGDGNGSNRITITSLILVTALVLASIV